MSIDSALASLEQVPFVAALRASEFAYPLVNALHVIGVALLFGAIVPLDLQLAGWRRDIAPVQVIGRLLLPVAIVGLVLALMAGMLLFATDARAYAGSTLFRIKMLLLATAIINALALHVNDQWRSDPSRPLVIMAGLASLVLWLAVIVLGRLVGYF